MFFTDFDSASGVLFVTFLLLLISLVHTLTCLCRHITPILQRWISLCVSVMRVNKNSEGSDALCACSLHDLGLINVGEGRVGVQGAFAGH